MTFGAPMLLLLIPAVLCIQTAAITLSAIKRRKLNRMFPASIRPGMRQGRAPDLYVLRQILTTLGLVLTAFALARPQWGYSWREASREGLQLLVVVDTSNSMRADDFSPTRLQRAKWGIEEITGALQGDKIGLVAFAGEGVLQCPLTLDYGTFLMYLEDLFPGIVPRGGTNLPAALRTAIDSFDDVPDADRVILLITDGESHEGSLESVRERLVKENIRVFAVGIGTPEGALIPLNDAGNTFLKNRQDEVVKSSLDEQTLKDLAAATGGIYLRAEPRNFGTDVLINEGLAPLKRTQLEEQRIQEHEERYQIFLALGLALLLLEGFSPVPVLITGRRQT